MAPTGTNKAGNILITALTTFRITRITFKTTVIVFIIVLIKFKAVIIVLIIPNIACERVTIPLSSAAIWSYGITSLKNLFISSICFLKTSWIAKVILVKGKILL